MRVFVKGPNEMAVLRWNSQHGSVFVDGSHLKVSECDNSIRFTGADLAYSVLDCACLPLLPSDLPDWPIHCYASPERCTRYIAQSSSICHTISGIYPLSYPSSSDCNAASQPILSLSSSLLPLHPQHELELGDEIKIDGHAPYLKIFDPVVL